MLGSIWAIALSSFIFNSQAADKVTKVTCLASEVSYETEKDENGEELRRYSARKDLTKVEFLVSNLYSGDAKKISLVPLTEEEPILVENTGKDKGTSLSAFNAQMGDLSVSRDGKRLVLYGDDDGVVDATLKIPIEKDKSVATLSVDDHGSPGTFSWADKAVACSFGKR